MVHNKSIWSMSEVKAQERKLYSLYRDLAIVIQQMKVMEQLGHNLQSYSVAGYSVYNRTEVRKIKIIAAINAILEDAKERHRPVLPPPANRGVKIK